MYIYTHNIRDNRRIIFNNDDDKSDFSVDVAGGIILGA